MAALPEALSRLFKRGRGDPAARLIRHICRALGLFADSLKQRTSLPEETLRQLKRDALSMYSQAHAAPGSPLAFPLAQAARDVFTSLQAVWDEMRIFEVQPDVHLENMVDDALRIADNVRMAVENLRRRETTSRWALMNARRGLENARRTYESALEELVRRKNPVDVLKTRELYRHIWRMGEGIGRCFYELELGLLDSAVRRGRRGPRA